MKKTAKQNAMTSKRENSSTAKMIQKQERRLRELSSFLSNANVAPPVEETDWIRNAIRAANHASYCVDEPRKQVAVKGALVMHASRNVFFGGEESQPYTSAVLTDPTWTQLFAEFKKQMVITRNTPHWFFEGVYKTDKEIDGVPVYHFYAGS